MQSSSHLNRGTDPYRQVSQWVLGLTLCLCLSTQAFAAHKHSAKPSIPAVVATEPSQTEHWAVMALKIGSIIGALLVVGHFELLSNVRWNHSKALTEKHERMEAALKAKADELVQAARNAEELRKQRDAWRIESQNPKNLYTPTELRKILG